MISTTGSSFIFILMGYINFNVKFSKQALVPGLRPGGTSVTYQVNMAFNINPNLLIIWGNCNFPEKNLNVFSLKIFPGNRCKPDSPWPLYEVNFLGTISSLFLDFLDYFWVEDHLLQTYFNFKYPRFTQNTAVKRNQVTKNCTSDLFILR